MYYEIKEGLKLFGILIFHSIIEGHSQQIKGKFFESTCESCCMSGDGILRGESNLILINIKDYVKFHHRDMIYTQNRFSSVTEKNCCWHVMVY